MGDKYIQVSGIKNQQYNIVQIPKSNLLINKITTMNNSFDKYQFSHPYQLTFKDKDHSYFIHQTEEHTFDQRNQPHTHNIYTERTHNDSRTEDQVINNLNFSIEDLLSKISKATAEFQQPPKFYKPHSKSEYPAVFKLSNLSASTQATTNHERSDPYIQRYKPHTQTTRKSEPHKENFQSTQKNVRNAFVQKQNSLYQTHSDPKSLTRNQLRSETYNHSKNTYQNFQTPNHKFDFIPSHFNESSTHQWAKNSLKNQQHINNVTDWEKNTHQNYTFLESNQQRFHQMRQSQQKDKVFQLKYELHQNNFDIFPKHQQKDLSKTQQINYIKENKLDDFENDWINYEKKMNELKIKTQKQSFENFSFKDIQKEDNDLKYLKNDYIVPQKKQFTSQPQIHINLQSHHQWSHSATSSPKKQIKTLLNPFQEMGFGNNNPIRSRAQKKSIILEDDSVISDSSSGYRPVPVTNEKKVNSLFDGKRIRQVAASTIIQSPDKEKKLKMQNPFTEILQTNNNYHYHQHQDQHLNQPLTNVPTITINAVQKSEIVHQQYFESNLTIQDFHLGKQLGSGKFGDVYQAIHKATGCLYAIKKIFKSTILQYNMVEQFTRQLKIHYSLNYPNIIKLYTHFDDEYHVFLVMQYGEGGMLMEKVKNGQKFSSIIVQQMLRAVEYLHNKKIAHRDIKPQNIVLMFGDTAKLCDFGWSRVFDSDMKKTFCGTLDYVSPQMKDKGQYSLKIDVWSLGVLTFQLLCGFAPFKDEITNWKKKGGNLNKAWNWNILYPPDISSVAQSFMRNLLKQNPQQRANIRFCLNHLFIRKYNEMSFNQEEEKRFGQISMILKD